MQKVITPEQLDEYLSGTSRRYESFDPSNIGGSVTRAEDTSHLGSPRDLHDGLRLDYDNTPQRLVAVLRDGEWVSVR